MLWIELVRDGTVIASNKDDIGIVAPHHEEFREMEIQKHPVVDLVRKGDVLNFNRNDETCTVLNGRQVTYQGEAWFLSNLTNKLLNRTGPMHGAPYWSFNGKNLNDIYNETYKDYTFE